MLMPSRSLYRGSPSEGINTSRKCEPVALRRHRHRHQPTCQVGAQHGVQVTAQAEVVGVLVRLAPLGCMDLGGDALVVLYRRLVAEHQVDVPAKQQHEAQREREGDGDADALQRGPHLDAGGGAGATRRPAHGGAHPRAPLPRVLLQRVHRVHQQQPQSVHQRRGDIDEEEEEGLVVAMANAVVHPGAVMVHAEHASLADAAVVAARWLGKLALLAETCAAALLLDLSHYRICLWVAAPALGHLPGVGEHAEHVAEQGQHGVDGEHAHVHHAGDRVFKGGQHHAGDDGDVDEGVRQQDTQHGEVQPGGRHPGPPLALPARRA
mmetsp:Transcript_17526/g.44515  ORF Transcript_17526/g.44515 Transcript_17526/m.44515 type:complete len:322 (-) Transcript_17526:244-1209(-)